jgi:cytochrome P450
VQGDQVAAYDAMRRRAPVAHSDYLGWSVFRHGDAMRILHEHQTFSNAVSTHLNVPNGLDPPLHTDFRQINDRYFTDDLVGAFEPTCRNIAAELVAAIPRNRWVKVMAEFAELFALRMQSAYLGWPEDLQEPLRRWTRKNHEATLAGDRIAMAAVAVEFDQYIRDLLAARRRLGVAAPPDLTTRLLTERVRGRVLTEEEIVSTLRNWTVGELGTIAASVGIIAHYLSTRPKVQVQLRGDHRLLPAAIDEILRIHAPLISNRRITTCPTEVGGRQLGKGERLTVLWASANRDEAIFGDPDEFRLDRDPAANLLYGAGIHVCPGAPLARLELRVLFEELLDGTALIEPVADQDAVRAVHPGSGFTQLPLWIR